MTHYWLFALAFAASAGAPGPEIAALVSRALDGRVIASAPLAAGMIIGKLCMLTAAVIGIATALKVFGPMFFIFKFLGAAYLAYLGFKKYRDASQTRLDGTRAKPKILVEVGLGLAMTLSNPIAIAFYVALLPGVLDVSGVTLTSYLVMCAIITVMMSAIVAGYGLVAGAMRKLFSSAKAKSYIDRASGALMISTAMLIAIR
jgi:threonine/homoserine/homoserine lactone efflux protein